MMHPDVKSDLVPDVWARCSARLSWPSDCEPPAADLASRRSRPSDPSPSIGELAPLTLRR